MNIYFSKKNPQEKGASMSVFVLVTATFLLFILLIRAQSISYIKDMVNRTEYRASAYLNTESCFYIAKALIEREYEFVVSMDKGIVVDSLNCSIEDVNVVGVNQYIIKTTGRYKDISVYKDFFIDF